jgi:hypothetical protein
MKPRILMQQEDSGSGSGAPAPTPAEPQAQGAVPAVDASAIAAQVRDSLFAELRRSGVLGKEKPAKPTATEPSAPPQINLRALDRAVARHPVAAQLSDRAYERMERAFQAEAPDDATAWIADYFQGMGVAAAQPATPAAPAATIAAPAPRTAVPISSGGGSPPAPTVPLEERDILSLSESDRQHLIKQKGARWYMSKLAEQTKDKSIRIR